MPFYRRRLPHWHPGGVALFITFRLAGSLPCGRGFAGGPITNGRAFVAMDRLLDTARSGPLHLRQPEVAQVVVDSIHCGAAEVNHYKLHAFVVMPNHVHILITPQVPVPKLIQTLKRSTARRINEIIGATGRRFWQDEYFDRAVRNQEEFDRIVRYVEHNPVKAGLCREPEGWLWSSVNRRETGRR